LKQSKILKNEVEDEAKIKYNQRKLIVKEKVSNYKDDVLERTKKFSKRFN